MSASQPSAATAAREQAAREQHALNHDARRQESVSWEEKRSGVKDRRIGRVDRRNEDRVAEEIDPRRNPEVQDRRLN